MVDQVAVNGLIRMFCEANHFVPEQISAHSKRDYFLAAYLNTNQTAKAKQLYKGLTPTLEVLIIQTKKFTAFTDADRVLDLWTPAEDKLLWLETLLKFWQSGNLCRLGSAG
jgi:hypothetical protein